MINSLGGFYSNTLCYLPWVSITIETNGCFRVCCFAENSKHGGALKDNESMNILTHSIKDALNSDYHKELRKALASNQRHSNCIVCWKREDAAKLLNNIPTSTRYKRNVNYPFTNLKYPEMDNDGALIDISPISLDIRFSNLCNMKCIMCGPAFSNLWYQDWEKLKDTNKFNYFGKDYEIKGKESNIEQWENSDKWWNEFDSIKDSVKHVYFAGGEPFLSKANERMLDVFINNNLSKDVVLEYDTNLSIIPDNILKKLDRFKQVNVYVSVEDTFERYELIRFPGKFNRLLDNLERVKKHKVKVNALSSCVGVYSLFAPIRMYEFFSKIGYEHFNFRHLRYPIEYDPSILSDDVKKDAIRKYSESTLPLRYKKYMISYLYNSLGSYNERKVNAFIKRMDKLDEIRGTNWKTTFPEIYEYLK